MKNLHSLLACLSLVSGLLVGCTSVGDNQSGDDQVEPQDDGQAPTTMDPATPPPAPFLPKMCSAIADHDPAAVDGEFTLYIDGDAAKPWTAYCYHLSNGGKTYLPLRHSGNGLNVSMYKSGALTGGTDVITTFTKVHFDPETLMIDMGDLTFATSTGSLQHPGGDVVTAMPFGVAMGCGGGPGEANIALADTPFQLVQHFTTYGAASIGGASVSIDLKRADITGDGNCGWTASDLAPWNPMNATGDYALALAYDK